MLWSTAAVAAFVWTARWECCRRPRGQRLLADLLGRSEPPSEKGTDKPGDSA